ncbi:LysR family transcriptional regulator [Ruegeria sp. SCPT10]|uniref:LysR family transcriptional regulator n=1 Tax=Ruegeria sp. SCP10 TaxID=3141377 RepID=UPI003339E43F
MSSIAAFVQVAEHGAFNEAARAMDLSPSAASKAVTRLEDHLGVKLLNRTTRSVSLTPEGERYLDGAKKALADLSLVGAEVTDTNAAPKGRLRVSAASPMARLWLADVIAKFSAKWPEVQIDITLANHLTDLAAEGIDLAIRSGGLAESEHLIARKLYDEDMLVCATPAYWNKAGRPDHPSDLAKHRGLRFRAPQTGRLFPWMMNFDGALQRIELPADFVADEGEMILNLALRNAGVAQFPGYMVRKHLASGTLEEALAQHRPPATPISAMYLDRRLLSPRIRTFVDFLKAHVPVSEN